MTLEEAIKHAEEVAKEHTKYNFYGGYESCDECAKEHRQLAGWLRELKNYREILLNADKIIESEYGCVIIEGYADVVNQMIEVFMEVNADE